MKFLAIIPARGGSKGIPKKNIKEMAGKPLIQYTIGAAQKSRIDKIVVSTDDNEIRKVVEKLGVDVIMRPDELAQDSTPTLPVLLDVVEKLEEKFDAVVTLQPTSPLRKPQHIDDALSLFEKDEKADSLVSVVEVPHNCSPSSIMEMEGEYIVPVEKENIILRRQDKPVFWARNGAALYITRIEKLKDFIWGGDTIPYPMSKLESLDIDDMEDWLIVESILKSNSLK